MWMLKRLNLGLVVATLFSRAGKAGAVKESAHCRRLSGLLCYRKGAHWALCPSLRCHVFVTDGSTARGFLDIHIILKFGDLIC